MATSKQRLKAAGTGHIAEEQFVPGEPGVIEPPDPPDPPPADKPKKSTQEGADKAPSDVKEETG